MCLTRWWHRLTGAHKRPKHPKYQPISGGRSWDDSFLAAKRSLTDQVGDEVIAQIMQKGEREEVNKLFRTLTRNRDHDLDAYPPEVAEYFRKTAVLPAWTDMARVKRGQDVFLEYGPSMAMVLLAKSMPESYACADGALVLYETGRLNAYDESLALYAQRLAETSQFVLDVMQDGGLDPMGKGVVSAQKVRLIHAAIRYMFKERDWDSNKYGEPVNQEDMAGTLMAFSVLVLDGMRMMNTGLSDQQERDYYYAWRVMGHVLGVDEDLIPEKMEDAYSLGLAILNRNVKPSKWGTLLTRSCADFIERMVPGDMLKGLGEGLIYFMVGKQIADVLEVTVPPDFHEDKLQEDLKKAMGITHHMQTHRPFLERFFGTCSRLFMEGLAIKMNDRKKVQFDIPPDFVKNWNLKTEQP